ncbi:DUF3616 domain-containing protein [Hansschlegelia sp. KR7-227]|uniref:DUF3616 domain-containing protein n=1 Tax=Hansschlegelia sp. KR7-227 TaxID=3400914 RepID=UPI003BFDC0A5
MTVESKDHAPEGALPTLRAAAAAMHAVQRGQDPAEAIARLGVTAAEYRRLSKAVEARRKAKLVGRVTLAFHDVGPSAEADLREDVSAVVAVGDGECLWIGADEGASLERLSARRDATGRIEGYGDHVRFDLHDFFDFPGERDEEADVEGMAIADGFLWIVGSHSLKRKKPKGDDDPEAALEALTTVRREANRFLLGRIPLVASDRPGVPTLAKTAPAIDGGRRKRRAGALSMTTRGNPLSRLLASDVHLGPFLQIPSKDNGFDVEGMAVAGDRVFLGLRGPVLRGWATILEVAFKAKKDGRLKLKPFADDQKVRKHFLDLDGLGVRSLLMDGADFLILAGPTMDLDGPVRLYRWRGALDAQASSVVAADAVEHVLDLPFGEGDDHAEGATFVRLAPEAPESLLVAYDSPSRSRLVREGGVLADLFEPPTLD